MTVINPIFGLLIFSLGLFVGSFLNCAIYRMERAEGLLWGRPRGKTSFLRGRSYCPRCEHTLGWKDLIPILSFVWLRGRCRYCKKSISIQYPLVELATGTVFIIIFLTIFLTILEITTMVVILSIYYLVVACFLIIIFIYDLKHYIIPDKVIYPAILTAGIFNFQFLIFNQPSIFKLSILSALGAASFFLAIVLLSKGRWMGVGDVKLAFFMGLVLGYPDILAALFLAVFLGAIIGMGLMALGKKQLKSEVPFGPFLVAGTFLSLFWGDELARWYFSHLII